MTTFVFVILNIPVGANVGPTLALTSDVGVVIPSTATVAQLIAGVLIEVDVLSTTITVTSQGLCINSIDLTMPTLCYCYTVAIIDGKGGSTNYTACDGTVTSIPMTYFANPTVDVCARLDSVTFISEEGSVAQITGGTTLCEVNNTCVSDCHCLSFSYPGLRGEEFYANISYIDCNGDLIEDRIYRGDDPYQVCGNTPTSDNVDVVIVEGNSCRGIQSVGGITWECAPCTTDKCLYFVFPVSDTNEANITYTDCNGGIYEDVIESDSINAYCGSDPTCDVPEVIIIESGVFCSGKDCFICKCHTIYNPGTSPAVVSYINCTEITNEYITTSINGGVVITVCAIPGTISAPLGVVVTNLETVCETPGSCA